MGESRERKAGVAIDMGWCWIGRDQRFVAQALVRLTPVPVVLLLIGACSGDESTDGPGHAVRDSAGVEIVENRAPVWSEDEGWRIGDEPTVEIGVAEGDPEHQLYRVSGAVRLDDGRIVVANSGTQELRFYNAEGAFLQAVGGEGEGPGEFRNLGGVQLLPPDTLLAFDWNNRHASFFELDGDYVRSVAIRNPNNRRYPQVVAPLPDGGLLVRATEVLWPGRVEEGLHRNSLIFYRYDLDHGSPTDTIVQLPGFLMFVDVRGTGINATQPPFAANPHYALAGDGLYYGLSDAYEIGYYGTDGALRRSIRVDRAAPEVTDRDIERHREERLENAPSTRWRVRLEELWKRLPVPERMPVFSDFVVDATGHLWVRDYARPGLEEEISWTVFDPRGRMLGTAELPLKLTVYEIADTYLLGKLEDEMGVERVQLYELRKTG